MKKTVLEWLNESKLLEKRISKKETELSKKLFSITYEHNRDKNYKEEEVKSEYVSLLKLKSNLDKIKDALMMYNATTKIKIGDKEMSIVYALNKYKNGDDKFSRIIKVKASDFTQKLCDMQLSSQEEKSQLDRQLLTKNNISEKDRALIETTKSSYDVVALNPLDILNLADSLSEEDELFRNEVNNKINLSNARTELEIDI